MLNFTLNLFTIARMNKIHNLFWHVFQLYKAKCFDWRAIGIYYTQQIYTVKFWGLKSYLFWKLSLSKFKLNDMKVRKQLLYKINSIIKLFLFFYFELEDCSCNCLGIHLIFPLNCLYFLILRLDFTLQKFDLSQMIIFVKNIINSLHIICKLYSKLTLAIILNFFALSNLSWLIKYKNLWNHINCQ